MKLFSTYRAIMWYGLLIFGLIVGVLFEYGFFSDKLNKIDTENQEVTSQVTLLESRKNALEALTPEVLAKSTKAAEVLPSENSVLSIAGEIRSNANDNQVSLKNLSVASIVDTTQPELGSAQTAFIAEGNSASIMNFLAQIPFYAPLLEIEGLNVNQSSLSTLAQVNIRSFWSALPTKLPALTEAVVALSPEENELLTRFEEFRTATPAATIAPSDQPTEVNADPFKKLE